MFRVEHKVHSRTGRTGNRRSVASLLAYRLGLDLEGDDGRSHNYANRGGVVARTVMLGPGADEWAKSPQALAAAIDKIEKRHDAQLMREYVLTLDRRLTPEQQRGCVEQFVRQHVIGDKPLAVTVGIHSPKALDGAAQPHAHVAWPDRPVEAQGLGKRLGQGKGKEGRRAELVDMRAAWAEIQNAALAHVGHKPDLDHRSRKDRGLPDAAEPKMGASLGRYQRRRRRNQAQDPRDLAKLRQVSTIRKQRMVGRQVATPAPQRPAVVPAATPARTPAEQNRTREQRQSFRAAADVAIRIPGAPPLRKAAEAAQKAFPRHRLADDLQQLVRRLQRLFLQLQKARAKTRAPTPAALPFHSPQKPRNRPDLER